MYYTGIGSRETPDSVLIEMAYIATLLDAKGYVLRSGAASGADTAFASGALNKVEYLPWNGFGVNQNLYHNGKTLICLDNVNKVIAAKAELIASKIHGKWSACKGGAVKLHTRNIFQIIGNNLDIRSKFVVYWTPYDKHGNPSGGTATAVNLAKKLKIPTFNLNIPQQKEDFYLDILGIEYDSW